MQQSPISIATMQYPLHDGKVISFCKRILHLWMLTLFSAFFLIACHSEAATPLVTQPHPASVAGALTIRAEVWADNWFAFYLNSQLIKEDSVPITTERSFNAEIFTFEATYPFVLNFIVKDFKENDTGLEYIGSNRQQMGDGGFIAQFHNTTTGALVAATDATWHCLVTHKAPLDKACEKSSNPVAGQPPCEFRTLDEPVHWQTLNFDASAWPPATVYSAAQIGTKEGYDEITWDSAAQLIWSDDLETDNTLLCRFVVLSPR